ncbi:hypothetical protein ACFWUT_23195 [Streptomyces cyaneofuscatus]|uniref:hypothetical protein n=1 Tax=Streptomyces cyaneofuscatus TaxID=66883 RepID=UPI003666C99D
MTKRFGLIVASTLIGITGTIGLAATAAATEGHTAPVGETEHAPAPSPTAFPSPPPSPAGDVGWG